MKCKTFYLQKEAEKKLKEEDLPKFYSYIEKRKEQFGDEGFLTGNKVGAAKQISD